MQASGLVTSRMRTRDNENFLAPGFIEAMQDAYGSTRLGRQELGGELIEDLPGALWSRAALEGCRIHQRPDCERIIVAIDPPVTSHKGSDSCGIIVAGRYGQGPQAHVVILQDASIQGVSPERWAAIAIGLQQSSCENSYQYDRPLCAG